MMPFLTEEEMPSPQITQRYLHGHSRIKGFSVGIESLGVQIQSLLQYRREIQTF